MNAKLLSLALRIRGATDALDLVTRAPSALEAGRRAFLIAFILRTGPHKSQKQLARSMGYTPARVCQMLKKFNRLMGDLREKPQGKLTRV